MYSNPRVGYGRMICNFLFVFEKEIAVSEEQVAHGGGL